MRHAAVIGVLILCSLFAFSEDKPKKCIPKVIATFTAQVIGISDGDTITVLTKDKEQIKIRLDGIDAPEKTQAYGQKSKEALGNLVFGKKVIIKKTGVDRYGRTLAFVYVGDRHINDKLVADGWAWHYKYYNCEERIAKLESKARAEKKGLWTVEGAIPPWDYRKHKEKEEQKEVQQVGGKFWLNTSTSVRHNSSCRWYNNTKNGKFCNPNDGRPCSICGG